MGPTTFVSPQYQSPSQSHLHVFRRGRRILAPRNSEYCACRNTSAIWAANLCHAFVLMKLCRVIEKGQRAPSPIDLTIAQFYLLRRMLEMVAW